MGFLAGQERSLVITVGGATEPMEVALLLVITRPSGEHDELRQQATIQPGGSTVTFAYTPQAPGTYHWVLTGTPVGASPFQVSDDLFIEGDGVEPPAPVGIIAGLLGVAATIALIAAKK